VLVAAARGRESAVRSMAEGQRNVSVVPATTILNAEALTKAVQAAIHESGSTPLTEQERKGYAEQSLNWLARLAAGQAPGYDIRPAAETLLNALRAGKVSEEAQVAALVAAGRLPGREAQTELANAVLDAKKPGRTPGLRAIAAQELARHIQQYGPALTAGLVQALEELHRSEPDVSVRSAVALVLGSMRPDARLTGERLKGFTPQPAPPEPPPAKEPPPKEPPKEKEPPKDKDNP
jgi:hypothetical protein